MNVWRCWIDTELNAQGLSRLLRTLQFLAQVFLANEVNHAFFKVRELFVDCHLLHTLEKVLQHKNLSYAKVGGALHYCYGLQILHARDEEWVSARGYRI